jgi:hypothetical protein
MRKSLPKVLMLGWEFPPIINGGLGVACHDLSAAMSEMADITMIVPKSSPEFKVGHMQLIGINNIDVKSLENFPSNYRRPFPFKIFELPGDLNPYYSGEKSMEAFCGNFDARRVLESFNGDSLYGGDVIRKVMQYAEITSALASKMDFDVIHAHDWMTMPAAMQIKEQSGKPLVMHIHSLEVDRSGPESRGWVYGMEKAGMEYADLLMPVSNFTATNITKHYGISPEKISVVHNGSSVAKPFTAPRKYNEKTVLFVGRITRQKGPELFVDIARRVLHKNPDTRFVMAGVGDNFRSVVEKSSYQSLGNRVHLTGFLNGEKLKQLFAVSDVYCMPSVSEPFGLSAVEAAQWGIPCVISKQSGVSEVLSGALKFDFWDVDKAASYILSLLGDKILREKVVEDAYKNLKHVSWSASASKIIKAYSQYQFI